VDAEDELGDGGHRRPRLGLDPGILEDFGIIVRLGSGGEREIVGEAERAVEPRRLRWSLSRASSAEARASPGDRRGRIFGPQVEVGFGSGRPASGASKSACGPSAQTKIRRPAAPAPRRSRS
jgi:hypothetical protein